MFGLKNNVNGIIVCLFEILVGILLLINPVAFTVGIITVAGIVLVVLGLINTVTYFRCSALAAARGQFLMKGILSMLAGFFCIFDSQWFIATFPLLTIVYGLVILVSGMSKVQLTADMIRMKIKRWGFVAVSAVISILCAAVILGNPFASTSALWMFTGAVLIFEAIIDIVTMIIKGSNKEE